MENEENTSKILKMISGAVALIEFKENNIVVIHPH
jgi:hypothetical protein